METVLFHNKNVMLNDLGFFPQLGDEDLATRARQSLQIGIPVTTKLLDYFKSSCGIDAADGLGTGSILGSPRFTVGFERTGGRTFKTAQVQMTEFKFLIDLFGDHSNALDQYDVKFRLDIENLTEVRYGRSFKPDIASRKPVICLI